MKNELEERYERTVIKLKRGDISQKTAERELAFLLDVRDTVIDLEEQILDESRKAELWRMLFINMIMECGIQAKNKNIVFKPTFNPDHLLELLRLDKHGMNIIARLWELQHEINGYEKEYIEMFKGKFNIKDKFKNG